MSTFFDCTQEFLTLDADKYDRFPSLSAPPVTWIAHKRCSESVCLTELRTLVSTYPKESLVERDEKGPKPLLRHPRSAS